MDFSGILVLLPFVISIFFLLLKEDTIFPILGGLFLGSIIISRFNPFQGLLNTAGLLLIKALTSIENILIIILIAEVIILYLLLNKSGFIHTLLDQFSKREFLKNRLEHFIFLANCALFIDRNLSTLFLGIFSKPLAEKKQLHPARHAYLLNATSSSLWTLIPSTTVTPVIIAAIGGILSHNGINYSPIKAFYHSLPYQYFNIFSIFIVLTTVLFNRDIQFIKGWYPGRDIKKSNITFGLEIVNRKEGSVKLALYGLAGTLFIIFITGLTGLLAERHGLSENRILNIHEQMLTFIKALFAGIIFSLIYSMVIGALKYREWNERMQIVSTPLFLTLFYIALSMSVGVMAQSLNLSSHLMGFLGNRNLSERFIPLIVFIFSSIIGFLSGSPILTIMAVIPAGIKLTSVNMTDPLIVNEVMFATIASVISGATFGSINSPYSISFILSLASTGASLKQHFSRQIYFSSIAYLSTLIFGYGFFIIKIKPIISISIGLIVIYSIFYLFNKNHWNKIKQVS